jgi:formylmethanofuran dehydrogenase subunit C
MPLTITLKTTSAIPLEVEAVQLETVRAQPPDDVKRTPIQRGNEQVPLGECFDVKGSAAEDEALVWEGDCSKVKSIGAHWKRGTICVLGNAGMHLGAEMTGGEILVEGNADDWVGAEMHGGQICVKGNAGHLVGAVYRGGRRGMTGGEILIHGNAGNEIGHTLRRGLIAVGGKAGDAAGFNMIAGSIFLFGETGIRPGAGMRRGTIGLFGSAAPPEMLPTFRLAAVYRPVFLQVYFRELSRKGFPVPDECLPSRYRRYIGDVLELGQGEILVRDSDTRL